MCSFMNTTGQGHQARSSLHNSLSHSSSADNVRYRNQIEDSLFLIRGNYPATAEAAVFNVFEKRPWNDVRDVFCGCQLDEGEGRTRPLIYLYFFMHELTPF